MRSVSRAAEANAPGRRGAGKAGQGELGAGTRILRLLLYALALAGTPTLMFLGYNLFSGWAGSNLGIANIGSDYAEGVIVAVVLLGSLLLWPVPRAHRRALVLLWLVRMGVGLGAMLAFESIYRGDIDNYYFVGLILNEPLSKFTFGGGTFNIQALVGLIVQVTDSFNAVKMVFSYMGLVAIYAFYRTATMCMGQERIAVLYLLGMIPSLLLWTSILGKEPVVLLGISIFCYGAAGLLVRRQASMLIWVVLGLLIAASIRVWLGAIFVMPLIFTFMMASRTPPIAKLAFIAIAAPAFLLALQVFAQRFQLETAEDLVHTTDVLSSAWARGGSAQLIGFSFDSLESMVKFLPIGTFTALFRPLPLEVPNAFGLVAGLENALLLSLLLIGVMRRGVGWLGHPVLLWAATTLFVWGAVYGFVSYQNLGTGFRWRTQVTPLLFLLGMYLAFGHYLQRSPARTLQPVQPAGGPMGRPVAAQGGA